MPGYYNEILIIGPGYKIDHRILEFYKNPQRLIVGDGINPISKSYLKTIKKLIGPNTRIDIIGHGNIDSDGLHNIDLLKDTRSTKETLAKIGALNPKQAQHAHLWSCYGGAANEYSTALSAGSTFITHSPSDDSIFTRFIYDSIFESMQRREARRKANKNLTPVEEYVADFNHNVLQTATINRIDGKIRISHTTRNADIFFTEVSEQRRYLESEVQTIGGKFKTKTPLGLSESEVQKYMEDIIAAEAITKRGLKKLAKTPEVKKTALYEMIAKAKLGMMPLLNVAAQQSSQETFEAIDVKKNLPLDIPLYRSIYFGNKEVTNYIIRNNRFDLSKFNKIITKHGLKYLIETCGTETETNEKFWKIAALLESRINLEEELRDLTPAQQAKIIKSAAKNGYGVAISTLIEQGNDVPPELAFQCAANMKYKDSAKQEELTRNICPNFSDIKNNFSTALKENFAKDLKEAKDAEEINRVSDSYHKITKEVNISSDIDFAKAREQKLSERSLFTKIKDFCKEAIHSIKVDILEISPEKIPLPKDKILENTVNLATKKAGEQKFTAPSQEMQSSTPSKTLDIPNPSVMHTAKSMQATLQARQTQIPPATHTAATPSSKSTQLSKT